MAEQIKITDYYNREVYNCEVDPRVEEAALRAAQAAEFDKMLCGEDHYSDLAYDYAKSMLY